MMSYGVPQLRQASRLSSCSDCQRSRLADLGYRLLKLCFRCFRLLQSDCQMPLAALQLGAQHLHRWFQQRHVPGETISSVSATMALLVQTVSELQLQLEGSQRATDCRVAARASERPDGCA